MTALHINAGIYTNSYDASLNVKNGFPVFSTVIEANYVEKRENMFAAYKLTDEDKEEMHRLARDPRIGACSTCFCARSACAIWCWQNRVVLDSSRLHQIVSYACC